MLKLTNSPITNFELSGQRIYVKRDDLLDPEFNGNKARKLSYYLQQEFKQIDILISYGGNQSNLMYSLACLAKLKKWHFKYYTRKISQTAQQALSGNLQHSLALGMELIEVENNYSEYIKHLTTSHLDNELLIYQGAAQAEAESGLCQLATELRQWAQEENFDQVTIFLPSGTGASAYFLQKHLPEFKVYTTNCVGRPEYLRQQWQNLAATSHLPHNSTPQPIILDNLQFSFATPYPELWLTQQKIHQASQIEFDLVYDPIGWHILLANLTKINSPLIYIHCGGLLGNSTMQTRYLRLLDTL